MTSSYSLSFLADLLNRIPDFKLLCCTSTIFIDSFISFFFPLAVYFQLVELVLENGPHVLGIPMELKKELLLNLHEASTTMDPPEDWEGPAPDQLLLQLASAWEIELQQFDK